MKENNSPNFSHYKEHPEAIEYYGHEYVFGKKKYIQRTAKTTPKKVGQFVTLWKRNKQGITIPLSCEDDFDFVMILCLNGEKSGRFLFTKEVLLKNNILSAPNVSNTGKRGFRVYPNWDQPLNRQAISTQSWQIKYFSEQLDLHTI